MPLLPASRIRAALIRAALLCLFVTVTSGVSSAQESVSSAEVPLPSQGYDPAFERLQQDAQSRYAQQPAWLHFLEQHGDWRAMWGLWTGTPLRVWGEGFQIPGAGIVDAQNAESLGRTFIRTFEELLHTRDVDLQFVNAHPYLDKWTITFRQTFKGIPVALSEVSLRMTRGGRVFLFGADVFPNIEMSVIPAIPERDAAVLALDGLTAAPEKVLDAGTGILQVLPVRSLRGLNIHLAWQFTVTEDMEHVWDTWVDAATGKVLWRRNTVCTGITGTVTASVKENAWTSPESIVNIFNQFVTVSYDSAATSMTGMYVNNTNGTASAMLRGPNVRIERKDGNDARITMPLPNGGTFNVAWTSANSSLAERTTFYSVVRARKFILDMDPSITGLNYQMPCRVGVNAICNANYDGTNLNFYRAGTAANGTCPATGEMPDVVMHEYGHAVNEKTYVQFGAANGMINGALHEGLADANAALILDRSQMGLGFWGNNTVLRELNNTRKYPDDIINEVHYDGEIMGGISWDLRQNTGLATARQLIHFARHGKPDDVNTGLAFTKYFLEVLTADDNDGNLSNGTPHSSQIVPAFAKHGIPSGMLTIAHSPIGTVPGAQTATLGASVTSAYTGINVQSATIKYRLRGQGTWSTSTMTMTGGNPAGTSNWSGAIPPQINGTIVEYYIEASEAWGSSKTYPAGGPSTPLLLLVGFSTRVAYDCESTSGWQAGVNGDNATTGQWINAVPVGTNISGVPVQTGSDHSVSGTRCWVTGNGTPTGQPGDADVDGGKTTLVTPVLLTAGLPTPILRFYDWYSNDLGASPGIDPWVVQISSNGGANWINLESTTSSFNEWTERVFILTDYITPTNTVLVRFIARDDDPGSLVEAAVDDLELLYVDQTPVDLVAFTARRDGGRIATEWTTASETNNAGFTVEYRADGAADWQSAGFVPARGSAQQGSAYAFSFDAPYDPAIWVRLRQTDLDGKTSCLPEVLVGERPATLQVSQNYPNPFRSTTTVGFNLPEDMPVTLIVRDMLGREILTSPLGTLRAGAHSQNVDLGRVPSGTYEYTLIAGTQRISRTMHLAH